MKHLFVSYEIAKKLKELGFDEIFETFDEGYYYTNKLLAKATKGELNVYKFQNIEIIIAPLYQQVIDWFREKHRIEISSFYEKEWGYKGEIINFSKEKLVIFHYRDYRTYYEALNKGIEEAIKLIEK